MDCGRQLKREGKTVFYVCLGCEILWTHVADIGNASGWVRATLPIWKAT